MDREGILPTEGLSKANEKNVRAGCSRFLFVGSLVHLHYQDEPKREWVEKALFTRLNKLFEINTVERAHNVFLLDKNLQALIENPKPFIISVFPRLALLSLELDEHFVLKDFPFYEACLEEWEKKCQEGTLRQALTTSHPTSSSVVCHLTQKKKPAACLIQKARTPLPATSSSSSALSPLSSLSSSFSNDEVEARVDRLVPLIISRLTPGPNSPSKPTRSTPTAVVASRLDEKPSSIGDISYHKMRKPFVVLGNISEDSFECLNSSPFCPKLAYVPNREKVFKLLSCISFFTEREPLMQDMGVLFPTIQ
ncbi:hypothetical protein AAG906_036872 [Vitis piasezkii]